MSELEYLIRMFQICSTIVVAVEAIISVRICIGTVP